MSDRLLDRTAINECNRDISPLVEKVVASWANFRLADNPPGMSYLTHGRRFAEPKRRSLLGRPEGSILLLLLPLLRPNCSAPKASGGFSGGDEQIFGGSSEDLLGRKRKSRQREAAGRGNSPEALRNGKSGMEAR